MVLLLVVAFVSGDQSGGEIARMIVWVFGVVRSKKKSIASWKRESLGRRLLMGGGMESHQQPVRFQG